MQPFWTMAVSKESVMLMHVAKTEPTTAAEPPLEALPPRPWWRQIPTLAWFGLSLLSIVIALAGGRHSSFFSSFIVLAIALFAFSTLVAGFRALYGLVDAVLPEVREPRWRIVARTLMNLALAGFGLWGMFMAFMATLRFSRGRQLRRAGRVLLPDLQPRGDWTSPGITIDIAEEPPAGLADQWRENAKTEHASVAAFARLTLDLMALGAPPALIAAANQDALDEIRHTELCFSIARALDGQRIGPDAFPQAQRVATLPRSRTLALAKLAVDSLVDGALHEGVSARVLGKLARRCEVPAIREALKEIAADEGWHAAHGWTVVRWCVEEGGRPVQAALLGAVRALPRTMDTTRPVAAEDGRWERWGIHGHALEAEEHVSARAQVVERVRGLATPPHEQAA
jgi:hypothetical protein